MSGHFSNTIFAFLFVVKNTILNLVFNILCDKSIYLNDLSVDIERYNISLNAYGLSVNTQLLKSKFSFFALRLCFIHITGAKLYWCIFKMKEKLC